MIYNVSSQQTVNIVAKIPPKSEVSRIGRLTILRHNCVFVSDVFKEKTIG